MVKTQKGERIPFFGKRKIGIRSRISTPGKRFKDFTTLRETDFGITEFINQTEGFTASLKLRSDFNVNEIDLEGNIIKLTDLSVPEHLKIKHGDKQENGEIDVEMERKLTDEYGILSDKMDEIKKLYASNDLESKVEVNVTKLSKEERIAIHKLTEQIFKGGILTSNQYNTNDKLIKFYKNGEKWSWPADYTYFVLHKINIVTWEAVGKLAGLLRCNYPSDIMYASKTDKRAITSQLCSIRRHDPAAILNAASRSPNIHVGNFQFKSYPIKLQHLKGHRFRIALRDVTVTDELVNKAIASFESKGFINYFGLERFGPSVKMPAYDIGKALIKADWKLACETIMKPRELEPRLMQTMRKHWWEFRDAAAALAKLQPGNETPEAKILESFVLFGSNEYSAALDSVAKKFHVLWIQTYQCLLWNKVVSRRIKEWGLGLHEGDLVFCDKTKMHLNHYDFNEQDDDDEEIDCEDGSNKMDVDGEDNNDDEKFNYKVNVKRLAKADIASGKYTIYDLVLPLPGYNVLYPANDTEKWYSQLMAEDGITLDSFKKKSTLKYPQPGSYRTVIVQPESFKWRIVEYKSAADSLILSDLDELLGKRLEQVNAPAITKIEEDEKSDVVEPEVVADDTTDGGKAIILEFNLPTSSYTEMLVREILKIDVKLTQVVAKRSEKVGQQSTPKKIDGRIIKSNVKPGFNIPEGITDPTLIEAHRRLRLGQRLSGAQRKKLQRNEMGIN